MALLKLSGLFPKRNADKIPVAFILLELCIEVFFELYVVFPTLFEPFSWRYNVHLLIGIYFFVNFLGNFYLSIVTDLTSGSNILPSVLKADWHYCPTCTLNAPPRAFHCYVCEKCVLKRDHHCVYTGKCVGYNNQRYYMMTLIYFFLGSLFANYLNIDYTYEMMNTLNWKIIIAFFAPMVGWVLGMTESISFLTCLQCSTCVLCLLLSMGLIYYHCALIARGQTTNEWRKGIRCYDRGWRQNFLEVFGTRWYLVWLFPWISSPLPGDGIKFLKKDTKNLENVKDM